MCGEFCLFLLSGGLWSASRQSGPDGAKVQSIMGSPQGHCKTWDETSIETKNVRLPQRLRRENHHSEDCTSTDNQQVCSGVDRMFQWNLQPLLVFIVFFCIFKLCFRTSVMFFYTSAGFTPFCCSWAIQYTRCARSAFIALARSWVNLPWSIAQRESACYSRNRRGPTTERGTRPEEKW